MNLIDLTNYMHYTLIRAHKRTLSLQINKDGVLVARAPYLMPKFLIDRFVRDKERWIQKRLKEMSKPASPLVEHFTPDQLKIFVTAELKKHSAIMGLKYRGVRFTRVTSYWGTCSPEDVLSFNLALAYTPPGAVTYVVIHELAHIRWRGHGKRFWDMVHKYCPNANEMKALLRHSRYASRTGEQLKQD